MTETIAAQIAANIPLVPVPLIPEIRLHMAERLDQLAWLPSNPPPYWAYVWAGGAALARHLLAHPELVCGKRVLDVGSGSGIVAIAAAIGGATVTAAEIDANGRIAIGLNAAANGVTVTVVSDDPTSGPLPAADVILAGDMLYDDDLAAVLTPFFIRCRAAGMDVLLGDPGRGLLPANAQLRHLGSYGGSIEDDPDGPTTPASVYALI